MQIDTLSGWDGETLKLENRRLSVISEIVNTPNSGYSIKLEHGEEEDSLFQIDPKRLKTGDNKLFAVVSGVDSEGKEVRAKSEELLVHVEAQVGAHAGAHGEHGEGGEHGVIPAEGAGEHAPDEQSAVSDEEFPVEGAEEEAIKTEISPYGGIGSLVTLVLAFIIARVSIKKSKQEKGVSVAIRPKYAPDTELAAKIEKITTSASATKKRPLKIDEMEIFAGLPELRDNLAELSAKLEADKAEEKAAEDRLFAPQPAESGVDERGDGEVTTDSIVASEELSGGS